MALPSRELAEVFFVRCDHIQAASESYLRFAHDFNHLRKLPNTWPLGSSALPSEVSDLQGFSFEQDDIEALKSCKPATV